MVRIPRLHAPTPTHALQTVLHEVEGCLAEVSEVIFFIWGAMTIVEVVDSHQGFKLITDTVRPATKAGLLWLVGWLTFFMSSVLDNLTTTWVTCSRVRASASRAAVNVGGS